MLKIYPELLSSSPSSPCVCEKENNYALLTEKHLQILWLEQKYFRSLKTLEGKEIKVISPGVWNREAGPDFLKAHLRIGQIEYRGDVEIHFSDEGWHQHGHDRDPRYNQVILHISFFSSRPSFGIHKENGQQAFSCYLEENLTVSLHHILNSIDLDLYSSKQLTNRGRCAEQLFQLLSDNKIKHLFHSAAFWRLEKKMNYLNHYFPLDRSWQLAGGIAMALGYPHNAKAFFDLFLFLIPYRDLAYEELLAIALGCCGFLEEGRKSIWEQSSYYQHLKLLWWGRKAEITHQAFLKLNQIRPLHHPIRRLFYLVRLLQDAHLEQLWHYLLQIWKTAIAVIPFDFKQLNRCLLDAIPSYHDPYWDCHFTFEEKVQMKRLPSMGKELKTHILLNTILPLLYGTLKESGDVQVWEKFQQFYAHLKVPLTNKSRYLHHRFFNFTKEEQFLTQAQMVQGAYQLHQDFCIHFETSCEGCPFVQRYNLSFEKS